MDFIDASVIVKAFTENGEKESCKGSLREEFVTDALCLTEACNAIGIIKRDIKVAQICIKSLFRASCIIIPLERNVLFEALKTYEGTSLSFFDHVHLTVSLMNGCSRILSYDKDYDNLPIERAMP